MTLAVLSFVLTAVLIPIFRKSEARMLIISQSLIVLIFRGRFIIDSDGDLRAYSTRASF